MASKWLERFLSPLVSAIFIVLTVKHLKERTTDSRRRESNPPSSCLSARKLPIIYPGTSAAFLLEN
jgi:hypothetical protein